MVHLLERVIQNNYPRMTRDQLTIIANNIFIQGQMWGFRRWILQKEFSLEEYTNLQFDLLKSQLELTRGG